MSDLFTEDLALFTEQCAAWSTGDGTSGSADCSELSVTAPTKDSRRDMYVQWWLRAISFIGATATGIGVSEALHYLWK